MSLVSMNACEPYPGAAGCFEAMAHDLRMLLRMAAVRSPAPTAYQVYADESAQAPAQDFGMGLVVAKHTDTERGFILLPRRGLVEQSIA